MRCWRSTDSVGARGVKDGTIPLNIPALDTCEPTVYTVGDTRRRGTGRAEERRGNGEVRCARNENAGPPTVLCLDGPTHAQIWDPHV